MKSPREWHALLPCLCVLACAVRAPEPVVSTPTPQRARPWKEPEPQPNAFTASPRPGASNLLEQNCGSPDLGLQQAAELALADFIDASELPPPNALSFYLRNAGVPYVWVRAWAASGPNLGSVELQLSHWAGTLASDGQRRCGVALEAKSDSVTAVALSADVLADVSPVPRSARVGQWLPLGARLLVDASDVTLVALGPHGRPHELPVQLTADGLIKAQLPMAAPGRWLFQVLPTTATGPRPVAEVEVFADVPIPTSPDQEFAAGDFAQDCSEPSCARRYLFAVSNRARESEKLPPLQRDGALDELAMQHANAMQVAGRLGHDLGDGDPAERASTVLPQFALLGENVAHAKTARGAHRALWQSPAHRQNLLRHEFTHVGIGVAYGPRGVWVCELFAQEDAPPATY